MSIRIHRFNAARSNEWVLRAAPHKFGLGKIHIWLYEEDQTRCGRNLPACPGLVSPGQFDDVSCRSCIRSYETPRSELQEERPVQGGLRRRRMRHWRSGGKSPGQECCT